MNMIFAVMANEAESALGGNLRLLRGVAFFSVASVTADANLFGIMSQGG